MASGATPHPQANRLLAALPAEDFSALLPHVTRVERGVKVLS